MSFLVWKMELRMEGEKMNISKDMFCITSLCLVVGFNFCLGFFVLF